MPNPLTGDYEAVFQIGVRQINGVLAMMHQLGMKPGASSSTFPHSVALRIGGNPPSLSPQIVKFSEWGKTIAAELSQAGIAPGEQREALVAKLPLGIAHRFADTFREIDLARIQIQPVGVAAAPVRGVVQVQVSNPTVSLLDGAVSEVTVHVFIRAHYFPDPGTAPLPAPIHGEVRATYLVQPRTIGGRKVLSVRPSASDRQIFFIPEPGTVVSGTDVDALSEQVRLALRKKFVPPDVELPANFSFLEFKGLGTGGNQALVLPFQLSGAGSPPGGLNGVTQSFIGSSHFAIAVSKQYVESFLQALINSLKAAAAAIRITARFLFLTAHYTASVSSLSLTWKPGAIDITGHINVVTSSAAPNGFISFTQTVTVDLNVPTQAVTLKAVGDPSVNESWWMPHSTAVNAVKNARDNALNAGSGPLNGNFSSARFKLVSGLQTFDPYANATYQGVQVTTDGLILRGGIETGGRLGPVVQYDATGANAFTAFKSWIPGGRVELFQWTWVEQTHLIPWFNKTSSVSEKHRFIQPAPKGLALASRICLYVEGSRLKSDGFSEFVSAGEICRVSSHEPILQKVPYWWETVMVPIWRGETPESLPLEDAMVGHINVVRPSQPAREITTNVLIHFAGRELQRPLSLLSRGLKLSGRPNLSLVTVLILPSGSFKQRRGEVEAQLGTADDQFPGSLLITEDYLGGWSKLFGAGENASTHFINAHGESVWKQEGPLDPPALGKMLSERAVIAPAPRNLPLEMAVRVEEDAPETLLSDGEESRTSLRRLRGRKVLMCFWQSWSAPCVKELLRLQELQKGDDAPVIVAVNGGEPPSVVTEFQRRHSQLSPLWALDAEQAIAERYGVQCWPTTVSINRDGIIDRIQFGLGHDDRKEAPSVG